MKIISAVENYNLSTFATNDKIKINVSNSSDELIKKHIDDIYSSFKYACMFTF